ncbi:hypothetical protein GN958_ATG05259 [Phytophthora infestans]|uniref:Uncharacterized protein n=1 Tax=Phytophthora infestans TaxID=4787 RepID=A0A8S9UXZ5_PHYIN|nr:hypothetical protein GN958_ATG05259 [Phytophthora infestans]
MGFLHNIAGSVISLLLTALVAHYTELQVYAAVCVGIQWLSALYAIPKQNERYFDLTGSVTYAVVSLLAYSASSSVSWRESALIALVWL